MEAGMPAYYLGRQIREWLASIGDAELPDGAREDLLRLADGADHAVNPPLDSGGGFVHVGDLVTMPDGSRRAVVAVGRRVVVTRDDGRQARVHSSAKVTVFIDSPEAVLDEARREAEWSEGTRARYVLRLRRILEDVGPTAFGGTPGDEGDGDE